MHTSNYLVLLCGPQDVVIDEAIVAQKGELVLHVFEETPDQSGEMYNLSGLILFKDSQGLFEISARKVTFSLHSL